jgi:phosphopantetheine adenylyltransferase/ribosome-binding factor A
MNSLVKSLVNPLLESDQKGIALLPGGFKPPTVGHFALVDEVAKHPEVSKVIVFIGHKTRDGVTKEESKEIWDIYQKYLPSNVEIKLAENPSPISDVNSLIKNNPDTMFYPVVGIRGEMDLEDLNRFKSLEGKYENFKPIVIKSEQGENRISGTNTRAALISGDKDRFLTYLPTELNQQEKNKVWSILTKTPIEEAIYAEPSEFNYPTLLSSLIQYMISKGMNIRPLPKVKFIDNDSENAKNFFGKTAYYDPNKRVIVLYTMDRHPKDIMRSFAHEMIHHIQNLEDRLNGISTQNTNEEGDLPEIEREAYEKGNMTFRNWTDTLTEGVLKEGRYDTISNKISGDIFNYWKKDFEEYIQALNINTKGFEEDDLALPNPQEKSTPSPTIKEPLNENKPITIDMGKVNKALLKGIGHEKETDENILATIDAHPPGKVPHTTFLDFYAKFDKYFGEKDDDRVLDETGLEHILVNVLKLSPEDIKIVMDDYQKGNKDLEDVNWFEKYDTTHQKDEEWNPAGGKKFDDSKDTKSSVDNYLSKNKKLHEKKGFDKKLGKDPFGLNQFAREIMQEEEGSDTFDYLKHLKLLTNHMLNKGINLRPLPTVKFINDDGENAKDFFGKTAYYNPNSNQIVLYTLNRHPKDVMRSFAHEMIHHHQNCEDRLGNITTQNTNEGGDLPEIEREAYEKGNMTFRNWTDTLTEGILTEGRYDKISNTISSDIFSKWKQDFDQGLPKGKYVNNYTSNGFEFKVDATLKFLDKGESLKVDGGLEENENENIIYFDFEVDKNVLPEMWSEISMNLKDVTRHEIEHLTQSDIENYPSKYMENDQLIRDLINAELLSPSQYFKLEKEIDANLQGMYFRAKKEKRSFRDVIDSYLDAQDISFEQKEEILDLWRQRIEALSLPKF